VIMAGQLRQRGPARRLVRHGLAFIAAIKAARRRGIVVRVLQSTMEANPILAGHF
jgi:plasmid stabilization system protein ParE